MGCDYYATTDGNFKLKIIDYSTGKVLAVVDLKNLPPETKLDADLIEGRAR